MQDIETIISKIHEYPGQWAAKNHEPTDGKACVMEIVGWAAGLPWSDMPACVAPEIARLCQSIHDAADPSEWPSIWTDDRLRAILRAPKDIEHTRRRACLAAEVARGIAVERLRIVGRTADADKIDALPKITDMASALVVRDAFRANAAADADAYAAYAAAYAAAAAAAAADAYADYAADYAAADAYAAAASAADDAAARHRTRIKILDMWTAEVSG